MKQMTLNYMEILIQTGLGSFLSCFVINVTGKGNLTNSATDQIPILILGVIIGEVISISILQYTVILMMCGRFWFWPKVALTAMFTLSNAWLMETNSPHQKWADWPRSLSFSWLVCIGCSLKLRSRGFSDETVKLCKNKIANSSWFKWEWNPKYPVVWLTVADPVDVLESIGRSEWLW